jgi:hypothetical protein
MCGPLILSKGETMAKAPPVQTFEISCEVEVQNLGPAMVALAHIEGLTVTGSKLVTTVKSFARNERSTHTVKAEDFLIDWIADHPEFQAKEAVRHFVADGRTSGACYTALRVLSEKKLLRKLGEGRYTTLAAKHQPKKAKDEPRKHKEVGGPDFALRLMSRAHGRISSITLKKHFDADGRAASGVSGVIQKLLKAKQIKRVGEGVYELTPKKLTDPR